MKIKVTNIPVYGYIAAHVEIPDGTPAESLQQAIASALLDDAGPRGPGLRLPIGGVQADWDTVDDRAIRSGWVFEVIP